MSSEVSESENLGEGATKPVDVEETPKGPQIVKPDAPVRPTSLKAPSKIGRLCMAHAVVPKAGPPPLEQKNGTDASFLTMRRSSYDGQKSPLSDVCEETERDLVRERYSTRSSISPEGVLFSRPPRGDRKTSNGSMGGDLYLEATGRRRSSDHGVILTADTDSFIIGQRVWVGGIRPGQIAYIGETHFAPGDWAGIVLDEPSGKNDGCVSGKRYFQCEPKKGIFSRLTRLTHEPLNIDVSQRDKEQTPPGVGRSLTSPARALSPTSSLRSSSLLKSPGKNGMAVGDRVIVSSGLGSRVGILKYLGETKFAQGTWCGVQLDEPSGKNDGSVDGIKYFECPQKHGIFVPISKVSLSPSSRKSRLSRAGSRESLTSVGTLNSIATTNTSRLRMNAQKLASSTPKPVITPKHTFSLQDVIREKQNHIEQLMIERELDREDAQNQAMMYQKSINELKGRVHHLEKLLEDERKKSEDLLFSNDEATFCRDELNAQTQVYKERINELEQQIMQQSVKDGKVDISVFDGQMDSIREENRKLLNEIENLNIKIKESSINYEKRLLDTGESEENLKTEVQNLLSQNEEMKNELRSKDESNEKLFLETKELQEMYREETSSLRDAIKQKDNEINELKTICSSKESVVEQIASDVEETRRNLETFENLKKELEAECQKLRDDCAQKQDALSKNQKEFENLTNEFHREKDYSKQLQEKLTLFESQNVDTKKITEEYNGEITKLRKTIEDSLIEISELKKDIEEHESTNKTLLNDLESMKQQNSDFQDSKNALEIEIATKVRLIEISHGQVEELKKQLETLSAKLKESEDNKENLAQLNNTSQNENSELKNLIESKEKQFNEVKCILDEKTKLCEELSQETEVFKRKILDFENMKISLETDISTKLIEINNNRALIENLNVQITNLNLKFKDLEQISNELREENKNSLLKLEEYERQLRTVEDDKSNINSEVHKRTEQLADKQAELEKITSELDNIKKALENSQREYEELRKTNENERNKLSAEIENYKLQLTNKIQEYGASKSSLEEQINNLKQQNTESRRQLEEKEKEFEVFKENSAKLQREIEENNNKLKTEIESLNNEYKNAQDLQQNTEKKLNELELKYSDVCRRYDALEQKCNEITSQKDNLQQELNAARSSSTDTNAEITRLAGELASKQKSYEELLDSTNKTKIELENKLEEVGRDLNAKVEEIKKLQGEMEKLAYEKRVLLEEIEKIKQTASDDQNAEVSKLRAEFESERAAIESVINEKSEQLGLFQVLLDKSLDSLQQQIKNLQAELDKSLKLARVKEEDLLDQVAKHCNNQKSLWLDLQSKQKSLDSSIIGEDVLSFQMSMNDLMSSLDANKKLLVPESRIDSLHLECSSLKSSIDTTINQNNEFLGQIENLCQLLQEMQKEREGLLTQNDALNKKLTILEKEKSDACNNLEIFALEKDESVKKLIEKIDKMEKEKATLTEKTTCGENSIKSLQETLEKSSGMSTDLQKDLQTKVQEISEKATQLFELNQKLDTMQNSLVEKEKLNAQMVDELNKKVEELNRVSDEKTTENNNLSANISELKQMLEVMEKEKLEACHNLELYSIETEKTTQSLNDKIKEKDLEKDNLLSSVAKESSSVKILQEEIEATKMKSNSLQSELEIKTKELASRTTEAEEFANKIEGLLKEVALKDKSSDELSVELQKKIEEQNAFSEEHSKENSKLKEQVQKLEENIIVLDQAKTDAYNNLELHSLETERLIMEMKERLKVNESQNTELLAKLLVTEKSFKESQDSLNQIKNTSEELKNQLQSKEVELKERESLIANLQNKVGSSQSAIEENEKQTTTVISDLQTKLDGLMKQLFEKDEENHKFKQLISDLEQKLQSIATDQTDSLAQESHKLSVLSEQYSRVSNENNSAQIALKELRKNVEQHKNYIKQTEEKLAASEKERNELTEAQKQWERERLMNQRNLREVQLKLEMAERNKNSSGIIQLVGSQNGDEKQSEAHINFLNSIIADMKKKNDTLTARIEALEAGPTDFARTFGFEVGKRKPAPRLFCDICDEFDKHDTEDCPLQCSDSPPASLINPKDGEKRKSPSPPRKYCEMCEVFGHEAGECPNADEEETY